MVLDEVAGRPAGRVGDDAEEAAGPVGIALVGLVVGLQGQVAQLVGAGELGAEGLLGAADGVAQIGSVDRGVVEDEVEAGRGVRDAVGEHGIEGHEGEEGGCI